MIIGFCGFIGSGKDTAADYLVNFHEFRRDSFANTLKDAVAAVFGWDRVMLEGKTKEARAWREQVDEWWAARLNMPELTPRLMLQLWGTEVCRRGFHDDIWIASLENKLRTSKDNIVISDVRFPNEIKAIHNAGGHIYWIQRGALPEWYNTAVSANAGFEPDQELLEQMGIHASETAWVGTNFDGVLDNNGGIQDLYDQIKSLVQFPRASTANGIYKPLADSLGILS
jgi:hypothetical protein